MRARIQPDHGAREAERRSPDRPIRGRRDGVETVGDPLVLRGVERLVRLDVRVAFAVAVGVEHERGPALRLFLVAGLVEHLGVQPAHDLAAAARPQRAVRVFREHQVVGPETGADVCELLGLRIPHGEVAVGGGDRKQFRGRMRRPFLAERRVVAGAYRRGHPHPAPFVEHRVVHVVLAGPVHLAAVSTATAAAWSAPGQPASSDRGPSA